MSETSSVRRTVRAIPKAAFVCFAMVACDTDSLGPPAIAPISHSEGAGAVGVQAPNVKAGLYQYRGCFTEARSLGGVVGHPPMVFFDPPVCLPATLEIFEDGRWTVWLPNGVTAAHHPDWTFSSYDELSWTSRDGECRGVFQTGIMTQPCVTEPRYVRKMTFSTYAETPHFGAWYRAAIRYPYSPGNSSKYEHQFRLSAERSLSRSLTTSWVSAHFPDVFPPAAP